MDGEAWFLAIVTVVVIMCFRAGPWSRGWPSVRSNKTGAALADTGSAVVRIDGSEDASRLRSALSVIERRLERHYDTHLAAALASSGLPVQEHGQGISLLLWPRPQRAQLRCVEGDGLDERSELGRAVADAARVLARAAARGLSWSARRGTFFVLNGFLYRPSGEPCSSDGERVGYPAHTDGALAAVICDNTSALEVEHADGRWQRLELRVDECAVLLGREAAKRALPSCTHRVAAVSAPRVSLVLELRDDVPGARELAAGRESR